jgi:3-oxoacyl-[acyl-carrier-protein] synthase II
MGDIVEAQAIFSEYGNKPSVSAFKSYIGHTMSACGAIELIFTLYMQQEGIILPTLNLEEVDPRCDMVSHSREIREGLIEIASIQNFAFGGVNTILFIKRWE